jgi:hypothetical protein
VPIQPPTQWVSWALSLGVKWPGREADHSPPPIDELKNAWSYTFTSHYAFMAWFSFKTQGQIYLYSMMYAVKNNLKINAMKLLVGKYLGKRLLGKPKMRWKDKIKMNLKLRVTSSSSRPDMFLSTPASLS